MYGLKYVDIPVPAMVSKAFRAFGLPYEPDASGQMLQVHVSQDTTSFIGQAANGETREITLETRFGGDVGCLPLLNKLAHGFGDARAVTLVSRAVNDSGCLTFIKTTPGVGTVTTIVKDKDCRVIDREEDAPRLDSVDEPVTDRHPLVLEALRVSRQVNEALRRPLVLDMQRERVQQEWVSEVQLARFDDVAVSDNPRYADTLTL